MPVFFKNLRIAGYIRKGKTLATESIHDWCCFANGKYLACAAGLAVIGKLGLEGQAKYLELLVFYQGNEIAAIAEILEVEPLMVSEISKLHMLGVPALEIAECLEFEIGADQLDSATIPA